MKFSSRMSSRWFLNAFLAGIIWCNAEVGSLLAIHALPLHISAVWPASGFALAALLLVGFEMWPGILAGNLIYNCFHLIPTHVDLSYSLLASVIISIGSFSQAMIAAWILRRFCSTSGYFNSTKDILIFLFPAGIVTCLIACTIGVATLYGAGLLEKPLLFYTWLTFWVGDTLGVYIFTPVIVIWSLYRPRVHLSVYKNETVCMALLFMVLAALSFAWSYPVAHLLLAVTLWAAYRFGLHGATVSLLVVALLSIINTSIGRGAFVANLVTEPLIILVSYLEIMVASTLILAATVNEREAAWRLVPHHEEMTMQEAVQAFIKPYKR